MFSGSMPGGKDKVVKKINLDDCPDCGHKMTLLAISYVCDICNPPVFTAANLESPPVQGKGVNVYYTYSTKTELDFVAEGYKLYNLADAEIRRINKANNSGKPVALYKVLFPNNLSEEALNSMTTDERTEVRAVNVYVPAP